MHFVKSNLRFTYRKLNFLLTSSNYFFFLPLEIQKQTWTDQSIPLIFLLCLKRNGQQTFKSSSCKSIFLQCVHYWYNLLRRMFFIVFDNWKTLLFMKVCRYSETFESSCCCFLWSQCFERSPYFMTHSYILTGRLNKSENKIKRHMIDYIPWLCNVINVIKSFKKTLNSKYRTKLKIKSQRYRNTKHKSLVLPKNR